MAPNTEAEPPSTFPGIWKIPTGFGQPFRTAQDWLDDKRKDDDIGNFWRVHDKLYDLSPFVTQHPGGPVWLELTKGTDITEAFETSHVVNVSIVETTLAKYFIKDIKTPRFSPYVFKQDGFFKTLKRRIEPVMKKVGTDPTQKAILFQDALAIGVLVTMFLGTYMSSTLLKTISGILLSWNLITAHNFFHLKDCWRKYYFDMSTLSSHEFRVTHALSHHLYTNTLMDIELGLYPTYQFLPNRPKSLLQKYGPPIYSHLIYASGFWVSFGTKIYRLLFRGQKFRLENSIIFIELVILLMVAPSLLEGFLSWAYVHTVASFAFLTQAAHAAHHHPDQFHDGDEARADPDFGLCQLDATRDKLYTPVDNLHENIFVILATFGHHQLHHMFPTICHSKLEHIQPIFEQTLVDFKESFPRQYQLEMYIGTFRQLARDTCKKFPYNCEKKED